MRSQRYLQSSGKLGTGINVTGANNLLKQNGNPRWRASANLNWRLNGFRAGVLVNFVSAVNDTGPAQVNGRFFQIEEWTTVNVYGEYRFEDRSFLDGTRLRIGARNIFDKDPPLASNNFGFFGSLHNPTGRFVYGEISKTF